MKPISSPSSSASSSPSSSPAVSPSGHRCLKKSKKQRQRKQTLNTLRKMVGCDKSVPALELIHLIMDHIHRLQDALDTENFPENSSNNEAVQSLLRQLSIASNCYQPASSKKA